MSASIRQATADGDSTAPTSLRPMGDASTYWDAEAATFDGEPDHGLLDPVVRESWRRLLLRHLPPPPARVADLGCGTATLGVLLATEGFEIVGLDASLPMLGHGRAKATAAGVTVELIRGDASDPPLKPGTVDVVLCRHVLWALKDTGRALATWSQLLRAGGRIVLIEGRWSTGGGLASRTIAEALSSLGHDVTVEALPDERLWGRAITDERYLICAT